MRHASGGMDGLDCSLVHARAEEPDPHEVAGAPRLTNDCERIEPIRMCLACRRREPQSQLVRIVADTTAYRVDSALRLGGRGAYVHNGTDCWRIVLRRGVLKRALRLDSERSTDLLEEFGQTREARQSSPKEM